MFLENNAKKNNFACFWFLQLQFSCLLSKFPSFITFFFCYLLHIYLVKSKKCTHNLQQALLNLSVGRCQRCTWMLYLVVTQCLVDVIDLPGCSSCHLIPDNRHGCTQMLGCSSCHSMPDSRYVCAYMLLDVVVVFGCSCCHLMPDSRYSCT